MKLIGGLLGVIVAELAIIALLIISAAVSLHHDIEFHSEAHLKLCVCRCHEHPQTGNPPAGSAPKESGNVSP